MSLSFQIISYTFPVSPDDRPYYDVVRYAQEYVDYFHGFRVSRESIDHMIDLGVSKDQVSRTELHWTYVAQTCMVEIGTQ